MGWGLGLLTGLGLGSGPCRSQAVHCAMAGPSQVRQLLAHASHAPPAARRVEGGQVERQAPSYRMGRSDAHEVHTSAAEHSAHSAAHSWQRIAPSR